MILIFENKTGFSISIEDKTAGGQNAYIAAAVQEGNSEGEELETKIKLSGVRNALDIFFIYQWKFWKICCGFKRHIS